MGPFADAPVTFAIVCVNLAIFVGEVLASRSLDALSDVPRDVSLAFGADYYPLTFGLGQYERLVACCFLHGSLLHVAMNMWSLGPIGPFAERTVGSARYAVLYVVTGIAGSIASLAWGSVAGHTPVSVGASGAICGVMGAALVLGVRLEGWRSGIARQIAFWVLIIVLYGARTENIDNAAHLGGIAAGCATAIAWRRGIHYSKRATYLSIGLSAAVCVAAGLVVVWRGAWDPLGVLDANDRLDLVARALRNHDCATARRLLAAMDEAGAQGPELNGLRGQFERSCPAAGFR